MRPPHPAWDVAPPVLPRPQQHLSPLRWLRPVLPRQASPRLRAPSPVPLHGTRYGGPRLGDCGGGCHTAGSSRGRPVPVGLGSMTAHLPAQGLCAHFLAAPSQVEGLIGWSSPRPCSSLGTRRFIVHPSNHPTVWSAPVRCVTIPELRAQDGEAAWGCAELEPRVPLPGFRPHGSCTAAGGRPYVLGSVFLSDECEGLVGLP